MLESLNRTLLAFSWELRDLSKVMNLRMDRQKQNTEILRAFWCRHLVVHEKQNINQFDIQLLYGGNL